MTEISQNKAIDADTLGANDRVSFWRVDRHAALECLKATFRTHRYAPHSHDTYVIGVIEEGCEAFRIRGVRQYAEAGTLCFVNPGEVHDGEPWGGPFRYRMTYPSIGLLQEIACEMTDGETVAEPFFRETLVSDREGYTRFVQAHRLLDARDGGLAADEALIASYAQLLMRHSDLRGDAQRSHCGKHPETLRACDMIEAGYGSKISLADLATASGLNRYQLIRAFRRDLGLTPSAFLLDVRVRRARDQLAAGGSASDVAAACGFADQAHLTRAFKSRIGVTPAVFARG